jgi:RNA polymerase sigma-70 factor, ECF subfamily
MNWQKPLRVSMRRNEDEMQLAAALPGVVPARPRGAAAPVSHDRSPSDGQLLERIARGDEAAFEEIYRRFARPVFGFALRRLGDRGRAEEAVQETFTSVWRSARSYRPERGAGAPWLYAVARNAIVDRARSRVSESFAEPPDAPSGEPGPAERAESADVSWRVHRALEELPAHERTVLELAYWSGLSQSEVAEFLNIPLGTVKTRTRTALARLADVLEQEDVR